MAKKITKDSSIIEIASAHPELRAVFMKYGMGCIGCMAAQFETVGQAAQVHGLDTEKLVKDLNAALEKKK